MVWRLGANNVVDFRFGIVNQCVLFLLVFSQSFSENVPET
jgi:hypothetical protein